MMWMGGSMPAPGTKFLATYNGRSVVVVGGYERGPSSGKFLGGFQGEVLWYLGAKEGASRITISTLKDQSLPPGPINCWDPKGAVEPAAIEPLTIQEYTDAPVSQEPLPGRRIYSWPADESYSYTAPAGNFGGSLPEVSGAKAHGGPADMILAGEFGLDGLKARVPARELARQAALDNKISFEDAFRAAMKSFLEDASDPQSPLSLVMAEICADNSSGGNECLKDKELLKRGKAELKEKLSQPGSYVKLLNGHARAGRGERTPENWIFSLRIEDFAGHDHWAVVDRTGIRSAYNYGAN